MAGTSRLWGSWDSLKTMGSGSSSPTGVRIGCMPWRMCSPSNTSAGCGEPRSRNRGRGKCYCKSSGSLETSVIQYTPSTLARGHRFPRERVPFCRVMNQSARYSSCWPVYDTVATPVCRGRRSRPIKSKRGHSGLAVICGIQEGTRTNRSVTVQRQGSLDQPTALPNLHRWRTNPGIARGKLVVGDIRLEARSEDRSWGFPCRRHQPRR